MSDEELEGLVKELYDNWINGNRTWVFDRILSCSTPLAAFLAAALAEALRLGEGTSNFIWKLRCRL